LRAREERGRTHPRGRVRGRRRVRQYVARREVAVAQAGWPADRRTVRLDDPEVVRRDYADESRLSARIAAQHLGTGPDPRQVAFLPAAGAKPLPAREDGPGRGDRP